MDRVDLNPNEIACLLGATDYPQAQLPVFQQSFRELYAGLAKILQGEFSKLIERDISVQWNEARGLTYGEFVLGARHRSTLARIETQPDFGPIFLQIPPGLVDQILRLMLGGESTARPHDSFTETELRLTKLLYQQTADSFCQLWKEIQAIEFLGLHHDTDLGPLRLLPARQNLTVLQYAVTTQETTAELTWYFGDDWPVRAIRKAVAPYCPVVVVDDDQLVAGHDVIAELARTRLSAEELRELKVGDILQTDTDVGETLVVRVDGEPQFRANLGKVGDRKAVQIQEVLEESESPAESPAGETGVAQNEDD